MNKKDHISIYMFRNAFATFCIALLSFVFSLMNYYHCQSTEAVQRVFIYDIYTLLYFLLVWIFNYLIFEISKISYDIYEEKVTFIPSLFLIGLSIVIFYMPVHDIFQYDVCFLSLLIVVRMVKEMWKRTPELFHWLKEKRP